jgi:stalled ribosome rescue protein Dom34
MQGHYHAAVWIDHHQARVLHFNIDSFDAQVIHPAHHHEDKRDGQRPKEDQAYLENVTKAVADAGAILILGPANERTELVKHIEKKHPLLRAKVEAIEAADHMTDGEIVAHARKVLKSADRMLPQV